MNGLQVLSRSVSLVRRDYVEMLFERSGSSARPKNDADKYSSRIEWVFDSQYMFPKECVNRQISDAHDCGMGAEVRDKKYVDFAVDSIGRTNLSEGEIDVQRISKLQGCKAQQRSRWYENV